MNDNRQDYPDTDYFSVTLRPAPIRSRVTWELRGDKLHKNGEVAADLRTVTAGSFLYEQGDAATRTLKLKSSVGQTKIFVGAGKERGQQAEELMVRVLNRVEALSPGVRIHVHGGDSYIKTYFYIMAALAVLMIGMAVHGLWLGMGLERLVLSVPLAALCIRRGWQYRIWDSDRFHRTVAGAIEVVRYYSS